MASPPNHIVRMSIAFSTTAARALRRKTRGPCRQNKLAPRPDRHSILRGFTIMLAVCVSGMVLYYAARQSNPMLMMCGVVMIGGITALTIGPMLPRPTPRSGAAPKRDRRGPTRSGIEAVVLHETFGRGLHDQCAPDFDAD